MTHAADQDAELLNLPVLRAILQQVKVGVLITNPQRRIVYVNEEFTNTTGYGLGEVYGLPCGFLQGQDTDPADVLFLREALNAQRPVQRNILNYNSRGHPIRYRINITPIFEGGVLVCFVGLQEDYTLVYERQRQLEQAAYVDDLTHLGNRRALREALEHCGMLNRPFALLMIDLDSFKRVNDLFGHGRGDELLRQMAGQIKDLLIPGEEAFRHGGDEFTVLLTESSLRSGRLSRWNEELQRVSRDITPVSVGVASYPQDSQDVWEIYHQADRAMYVQKRQTR